MLRTIETSVISKAIEEMCIEANHFLSEDMKECLGCAAETENRNFQEGICNERLNSLI